MKTYQQWEESDVDIDHFLTVGDEVDEKLYYHMAGIVPPQYCAHGILQVGEADDKINGTYWYQTYRMTSNKFYYLGSLPELM